MDVGVDETVDVGVEPGRGGGRSEKAQIRLAMSPNGNAPHTDRSPQVLVPSIFFRPTPRAAHSDPGPAAPNRIAGARLGYLIRVTILGSIRSCDRSRNYRACHSLGSCEVPRFLRSPRSAPKLMPCPCPSVPVPVRARARARFTANDCAMESNSRSQTRMSDSSIYSPLLPATPRYSPVIPRDSPLSNSDCFSGTTAMPE